MRRFLGIFVAVLLHAAVLLFGGLLFVNLRSDEQAPKKVEVALLTQEKEKEKPKEKLEEKPPEVKDEKPPDVAEEVAKLNDMVKQLDQPLDAPALDASSLGAIEAALNGQAGSGDFAGGFGFGSGGRIGGTGRPGATKEDEFADSLPLTEIDQKPRVIYQATPVYPASLRGKKVSGAVSIVFVVDASGRVSNQKVEKSSHTDFEKPALDAVRQWKFEPGTKGGKPVACKMRISIRFEGS